MNKFLLIDDDPINNFLSEAFIKRHSAGAIITAFTSAMAALRYLEEQRPDRSGHPDVILLDINMPVMNGWEFLDAFEEKQLHLAYDSSRIFVLTSSDNPGDLAKGAASPFVTGMVSKPLDDEQVKKIVKATGA